MTGCYESVIGMDTQKSLKRFVQKLPERFEWRKASALSAACCSTSTKAPACARTITRLRVDENTAKTAIKVA